MQWWPLAQLPDPPRFRQCVCVLQNKLYISGGRKYYGALDILKYYGALDILKSVMR